MIVELDASKRLRTALNINVSPCRVLLLDNVLFLLEATAIDRAAAVFIPLHIVISSSGAWHTDSLAEPPLDSTFRPLDRSANGADQVAGPAPAGRRQDRG